MRRTTAFATVLGSMVFSAALLGHGPGISDAFAQAQPLPQAQRPPHPLTPAKAAPKPAKRTSSDENELMLKGQTKVDANAGTVGIVTARTPTGTMTQATVDLSTLLDKGERFEDMRVIPIISRGKMQNLWDLLYLKGVDAGYLQTDTLEYLKTDPQAASIKSRLRYIASMFPEEIHIIARPEIKTLQDLAGKKVSVNAKGTGSALTLPIIFQRLGIDAILEYESPNIAIERMKRGDLAAHTFVFGKPTQAVSGIKVDGFHMLAVPYTRELHDLYLPATFTNKDYPNLVPPGEEVETIAVGNVLAVFNWPENSERYQKVARFTDAFFEKFSELHKPGFHPKWKEVNIAADVPGWARFKAAEEWLAKNASAENVPTGAADPKMRKDFKSFLDERGEAAADPKTENELFQRFLEWRKEKS